MNMLLLFLAFAAAIAIGVVLLLARVLWRGAGADQIGRSTVNAAVLRDQLAELERDRINGVLSTADHEQVTQELQRRVLDEGQREAVAGGAPGGSKRAAVALAVILPLAAVGTYAGLGSPAALLPPAERAPQVTQAQVEAMVASLEEKMKRDPDNLQGWVMLARSYRTFERYEEAAVAFSKAGAAIDAEPQLLAEYAETLAVTRGGTLQGEPTQLLARALELDPQQPFVLALAGSAASERNDHAAAIDYWQRLLAQLAPDSDEARAVAEGIDKARSAQAANSSAAQPDESR